MYSQDGKRQEGVAIIEMAVFVLVFSFLVMGLFDFGSILNSSIELSNAVRIGTQVAIAQPTNTTGITYSVKNGSTLPAASVTSTATKTCECAGVAATCGAACGSTQTEFMTVTGSYSVPLVLTYPGVTSPYPVNKSVTVRTK